MRKLSKKKGIILVVVLAFIFVAFAGCGDGNDSTPTQGNNAQVNNPVTTNPPANDQQENNPTTTPPIADNTPTETPTPTTEPEEDNQPYVYEQDSQSLVPDMDGWDRSAAGSWDQLESRIRRYCRDAGCSDEDTDAHVRVALIEFANAIEGLRNPPFATIHHNVVEIITEFHGLPVPTTESYDNQPPTERRELNSSEQASWNNLESRIRRYCRDAGCSDEEVEKHIEIAYEMFLVRTVDSGLRNPRFGIIHDEIAEAITDIHNN